MIIIKPIVWYKNEYLQHETKQNFKVHTISCKYDFSYTIIVFFFLTFFIYFFYFLFFNFTILYWFCHIST